jgi:YYY domain-containing protein
VNGSHLVLYVLLLVYALAGGAALVARLLRAEPDAELRSDGALGLGLPLGLVIAAFPGWLLTIAARVPIARVAAPLGGLALAAVIVAFHKDLLGVLRGGKRLVLPLAILVVAYVAFVWLRFTMGDIRQTEKPMDFAILNALLTAPSLPIGDPWMAGVRFSYYHFGTYVVSLPMRVAGLAPELAYNVFAALLAALAAGAGFAAVRLRRGARAIAAVAAGFLVLAGTLDGLRQLLGTHAITSIDMWPSSRRVANAITEWPLFTFWLGDLHPHAVALPFLVSFAALAGRVADVAGVLVDAVLLAALLSANPWDLPAALVVLLVGNLAERSLAQSLMRALLTLAVSFPFLVPFLISPRPPFMGLEFWPGVTTSPEAFLHFGALLLVPALALGVGLIRSQDKTDSAFLMATLFPAIGIAIALLSERPVFGLASAFVLGVLYLLPKMEGALKAGFLFAAAGATLAAVADVVIVKDPYGTTFKRMNTIFKTWAGAWPLLVIATALLLPLALSTRRARSTIRWAIAAALVASTFHPLALAIGRVKSTSPRGMDGLGWLSREFPGDRKAVDWLRAHSEPTDVVVEASGGAYDDHSRIGTGSGRPTLLGWAGHEGVWRGETAGPEIAARQAELKTIYTSPDAQRVAEILKLRGVRFVAVGPLEKKDFGADAFPSRASFREVFSASGTALYEVTR